MPVRSPMKKEKASSKASSKSMPKKAGSKEVVTPEFWPTVKEMIVSSILNLKKRRGVSLQAIMRYIVLTYNVDKKRYAFRVKKQLLELLNTGVVVSTKGVGLRGMFKLSPDSSKKKTKDTTPKSASSVPAKATKSKSVDTKAIKTTVAKSKTTVVKSKSESRDKGKVAGVESKSEDREKTPQKPGKAQTVTAAPTPPKKNKAAPKKMKSSQ